MKIVNLKTIKKIFHDHGVQINRDSLERINSDVHRKITAMAIKCNRGNVKRVSDSTYHLVSTVGSLNNLERGE